MTRPALLDCVHQLLRILKLRSVVIHGASPDLLPEGVSADEFEVVVVVDDMGPELVDDIERHDLAGVLKQLDV